MSRGRPLEPGNKMGHGRPRGSRNKISQEAPIPNKAVLPELDAALAFVPIQ
jgi:hypothetical protein